MILTIQRELPFVGISKQLHEDVYGLADRICSVPRNVIYRLCTRTPYTRVLSIILILFLSFSLPSFLLTTYTPPCRLPTYSETIFLFVSSVISPPLLFLTLPPTYFTLSTFYLLSARFRTATGPRFHKRFLNASKTGNRLNEKEESLD